VKKRNQKSRKRFSVFLLFPPILRRAYRNQLIPKTTQRHKNSFTPFSDVKCKGSAANLINKKRIKHNQTRFRSKKRKPEEKKEKTENSRSIITKKYIKSHIHGGYAKSFSKVLNYTREIKAYNYCVESHFSFK
jgi:hypothetical protein